MRVKRSIKSLRPPLRRVAPLTFWICAGFVWVNILIAGLLSIPDDALIRNIPIPTLIGPLNLDVWGAWFLAIGIGMLISLYLNNWTWLKRLLIAGLLTKLIWAYALIYMITLGYNVYATTMLWVFLAWVQGWTIVFFTPTIGDKRNTLPENERYRDVD